MKKLIILLLTTLFAVHHVAGQVTQVGNSVISDTLNNKEFLLAYYQQTLDTLTKSLGGLTGQQLQFKPAEDRWSISQCLEHIVLTEQMLFKFAKEGMKKPANPERRQEVKATDAAIIDGITDRSYKAKAADELIGKSKYKNAQDALNDLQNHRKLIFDYLNAVSLADLRNHINDSPFGPVDAYQSFLFIAGHTARHTLQINEVKADKNF